jgi:hypothetical protein
MLDKLNHHIYLIEVATVRIAEDEDGENWTAETVGCGRDREDFSFQSPKALTFRTS